MIVAAGALVAGCAAEPDETFAVTGLELGSCGSETWIESGTTMQSVVLAEQGEDLVATGCGSLGCEPMSPTRFSWNVDRWIGEEGGAFLGVGGCLLVHVDATARLDGSDLVIETTRWTSIADTCTVDAVAAMRTRPCDSRTRLHAVAQ